MEKTTIAGACCNGDLGVTLGNSECNWHNVCYFPAVANIPWEITIMPLLKKADTTSLGLADIDTAHAEFINLLNQLETAYNTSFTSLFEQLLHHTEAHFEHENHLMEQYAFPARNEHKAEHARVLSELRQFNKRVDRGLINFGRAYIQERLPDWFKLHVTTMDSALAAHIKSRLY